MVADKLRYPTVLFDWGDTVMGDDPASTAPMVEWLTIEVIAGVTDVLSYLSAGGRQIGLATSAAVSTASQIRAALARGGLDRYFTLIYCFENTQLSKGEAFYLHILKDLNLPASEVLMVGDGFQKDVQDANAIGIFAVWFNPRSDETRMDKLHVTVHSMQELLAYFTSMDRQE